jgi:hypothetical protein
LAIVCAGWGVRPAACDAAATVLPPHSVVEGKSIGQWTADWWNWASSIPAGPNHPWQDKAGAAANVNQSGPVFFVAATSMEAHGANRAFSVPGDRYLLVPVAAFWAATQSFYPPDGGTLLGPGGNSEATAAYCANYYINVALCSASIDGASVTDLWLHREPYPVGERFSLPIIAGNIYGYPPPESQPLPVTLSDVYADGLWLMLAPLGEGMHRLQFRGSTRVSYGCVTNVTDVIPSFPADFDEDGDVDAADFAAWKSHWGLSSGALHAHGDADGDHDVDGADFLVWQRQIGGGATLPVAEAVVPEPTPALLAIAGFFTLAWSRRCAP